MPRDKMHERVPHISHQPSINEKIIYKLTEIQRRHIMFNVKSNSFQIGLIKMSLSDLALMRLATQGVLPGNKKTNALIGGFQNW